MRNALLGLVAVAVLGMPLGGANHAQVTQMPDGSPATVVFDHTVGNEYWVQARIASTREVGYANVRHESGQFQDFSRSQWDPDEYVVGMHVPPGERVQFQVLLDGADGFVTSCFFTHPAGVEQCDPGSTAPFTATFTRPAGNEWWQQVDIQGSRPIHDASVQLFGSVQGGQDYTLEQNQWGAYAGSHYAPSGTIAQFHARSGDERASSGCYRWPEVVPTACPANDGYGARDTRFDHKTGNEWWVEVNVGPIEPDNVWARDSQGDYLPLAKRSWGAWAASFHIEPGHQVQFTAHVDGGRYESCWFTHPQGVTPEGDQDCGGYVGPVNPFEP